MIEVTAAIIQKNKKVLICQRLASKNCGLLWEFPGGKIEVGETGKQCVIRECQEELGITLDVKKEVTDTVYQYPNFMVHLRFFLCSILSGTPINKEHNDLKWVSPDEFEKFTFCPADNSVLEEIKKICLNHN